MQYKELLKKILGTLIGGLLIVRPFLPFSGFLVYPFGSLIGEIQRGENVSALVLLVAVVFNMTHISLGALLVSIGFEEARKFRKFLLISTLILLAVAACIAAYLFGH